MDRFEREKLVFKVRQEIDVLLENRDIIEASCGQLNCNEDSCEGCSTDHTLRFIEKVVGRLRERVDDFLIRSDTWSYTIMGNKKAGVLRWKLFGIELRTLKDGEREQYPCELPDSVIRELIER